MNNSKQIEAILKSGSDDYNTYTFNMYVGILESCLFEDALIPLKLYDDGVKGLLKAYETPVQAIEQLEAMLDKEKLDKTRKFWLLEWIHHYLYNSSEIEESVFKLSKLLEAHSEQYSPEPTESVKVKTMQKHLKAIIQKEVDNIEQYLSELKTKERLNFILKMLPFVMPKTKNVHAERYEK